MLFRLHGHEGAVHRLAWGPMVRHHRHPAAAAAAEGVAAGKGETAAEGEAAGKGEAAVAGRVGAAGQRGAHILLGSCSDDRSARLWQVPLSGLLLLQQQVAARVQEAAAGAAARTAAAAAEEVEGAHTLQAAATLWGHTARVWDLAFLVTHDQLLQGADCLSSSSTTTTTNGSSSSSGNGSSSCSRLLVATGSEDCSCCLWDVESGRQIEVLQVRRQQLHLAAAPWGGDSFSRFGPNPL